jgi:hypothetical protein
MEDMLHILGQAQMLRAEEHMLEKEEPKQQVVRQVLTVDMQMRVHPVLIYRAEGQLITVVAVVVDTMAVVPVTLAVAAAAVQVFLMQQLLL